MSPSTVRPAVSPSANQARIAAHHRPTSGDGPLVLLDRADDEPGGVTGRVEASERFGDGVELGVGIGLVERPDRGEAVVLHEDLGRADPHQRPRRNRRRVEGHLVGREVATQSFGSLREPPTRGVQVGLDLRRRASRAGVEIGVERRGRFGAADGRVHQACHLVGATGGERDDVAQRPPFPFRRTCHLRLRQAVDGGEEHPGLAIEEAEGRGHPVGRKGVHDRSLLRPCCARPSVVRRMWFT